METLTFDAKIFFGKRALSNAAADFWGPGIIDHCLSFSLHVTRKAELL
jgi:hypothetical protein